jgi:hypothetical protein
MPDKEIVHLENEGVDADGSSSDIQSVIVEIFQRVVTDDDFKKRLIENPDDALKEYDVSEAQLMMIKNLNAEDLDKLSPDNLEEFFSADAAVYTPDESEISDSEAYSPEDFIDEENDDD